MVNVTFKVTPYNSPEYKAAVLLREEVLRKPLGMLLRAEDTENEEKYIHIVALQGEEVVATAMLLPQNEICKMRQVAVKATAQSKGIGSHLLAFCEEQAQALGFHSLYCHARLSAFNFYLKNGYKEEGEHFLEVSIPHVKMRKQICIEGYKPN